MNMSLTSEDLSQIRSIVEEVVFPLKGEIEVLRNDIKEIYDMLADLQKHSITDTSFRKLSVEEKLLKLNAELLSAASKQG
jgi:hypothetical protein